MKLNKNFFKNFLFIEMPLPEPAILAYEQKQKIFEMPPSLILMFLLQASFVPILEPLPHLAQVLHVSSALVRESVNLSKVSSWSLLTGFSCRLK